MREWSRDCSRLRIPLRQPSPHPIAQRSPQGLHQINGCPKALWLCPSPHTANHQQGRNNQNCSTCSRLEIVFQVDSTPPSRGQASPKALKELSPSGIPTEYSSGEFPRQADSHLRQLLPPSTDVCLGVALLKASSGAPLCGERWPTARTKTRPVRAGWGL